VTAAGYTALLRADVLEVLRPYADTAGSDILRDFVDHLARIDAEVRSFATMPLNKAWPRNAWQGFFHVLQDLLARTGIRVMSTAKARFWQGSGAACFLGEGALST
jgi:hypothetical protein